VFWQRPVDPVAALGFGEPVAPVRNTCRASRQFGVGDPGDVPFVGPPAVVRGGAGLVGYPTGAQTSSTVEMNARRVGSFSRLVTNRKLCSSSIPSFCWTGATSWTTSSELPPTAKKSSSASAWPVGRVEAQATISATDPAPPGVGETGRGDGSASRSRS
jgi:hypothetical protein